MNKAENYTSIIMEQVSNETSSKDAEKIRNKMLLAAKIEDALKAKGWKKLDLANRLNKKPSVITKWISGTHNFTTETLWDIEKLLGINLINTTNQKKEQVIVYQIKLTGQVKKNTNINYDTIYFDSLQTPQQTKQQI